MQESCSKTPTQSFNVEGYDRAAVKDEGEGRRSFAWFCFDPLPPAAHEMKSVEEARPQWTSNAPLLIIIIRLVLTAFPHFPVMQGGK